jgi:hypothetical protein
MIIGSMAVLCGLAWIYLAAENEQEKAVTGNTRHFLKMASPGIAAVVGGFGMLIGRLAA